jgi:hypothetical protein
MRKLKVNTTRPIDHDQWTKRSIAMEQYLIMRLLAMTERITYPVELGQAIEVITKSNIRIESLFRSLGEYKGIISRDSLLDMLTDVTLELGIK